MELQMLQPGVHWFFLKFFFPTKCLKREDFSEWFLWTDSTLWVGLRISLRLGLVMATKAFVSWLPTAAVSKLAKLESFLVAWTSSSRSQCSIHYKTRQINREKIIWVLPWGRRWCFRLTMQQKLFWKKKWWLGNLHCYMGNCVLVQLSLSVLSVANNHWFCVVLVWHTVSYCDSGAVT